MSARWYNNQFMLLPSMLPSGILSPILTLFLGVITINSPMYTACRSPVYSHGVYGWWRSAKVSEKHQGCPKTFWQQRAQSSGCREVGNIKSDSTRTGVHGSEKCKVVKGLIFLDYLDGTGNHYRKV